MLVRRAAPGEAAGAVPGEWRGGGSQAAPWVWAALPDRAARAAADGLALGLAMLIATLLRHDGDLHRVDLSGLLELAVIAVVVQTVLGMRFGLYTGRWAYGCFEEIAA